MKMMMHKPMPQAPAPSAPVQGHAAKTGRESLGVGRSLREHRLLALGIGILVLVGMLGFGLTHPYTYSTESLVYIQPSVPRVLSDGSEQPYDPSKYDSYFQQQMETVTRYDILQDALAQLGAGVWRAGGESQQSAIVRLQSALKVTRIENSYQMSISLKGGNPEAIAEVVNAVTDAYLAKSRKDELAQVNQRLQALVQERDRIQTVLSADRTEQAALGRSLGVANASGDDADPYDAQIAALRDELVKAREARDVAEVQLSSVSRPDPQNAQALNAMADEMIATDPGLSSMKAAINQRLSLLSSQMSGLTPNHPLYKLDQQEITKLNQSLDAMTAQLRKKAAQHLQEKLGVDLARSTGVEVRLNEQLAQQEAAAARGGPKLQRAAELAADVARQETRFASVDDMVRSLELESSASGQAHISMPALRPFTPDPSKKMLLIWGAFPIATLVGVAAAITARKLKGRVYIAEDVKEVLQFPPMAVMPQSEDVSSATVEEYTLRLAAAVDHALRLGGARTFVFTAVSASTAVEDLVANLARKMDGLGHRVSMMSAAAAITRHSRGELSTGALGDGSSLLRSDGSMTRSDGSQVRSDAFRKDDTSRSSVMDEVQRFQQEDELLLITAQPLMTSGESEYLVRYADVTILVAESGVTTRKELEEAGLLLERLNTPGAGAVLTNLSMRYADAMFKRSVLAFERRPREAPSQSQPRMQDQLYSGPERRRAIGADSALGSSARAGGDDRRRREGDRAGSGPQPLPYPQVNRASAQNGHPRNSGSVGEDQDTREDEAAANNDGEQVDISIDIYNGPDRRIHLPYHVYVGVERRASNLRQTREAEVEKQRVSVEAADTARNITPALSPATLPSQPMAEASAPAPERQETPELETAVIVSSPAEENGAHTLADKAEICSKLPSDSSQIGLPDQDVAVTPTTLRTPTAAASRISIAHPQERKSSEYSAFITETFVALKEALAAEIASAELAASPEARLVDSSASEPAASSSFMEESMHRPEILPPTLERRTGWMRLIDRDSRMVRAFTGEHDGDELPTLPSKPGQYGRRRM